MAVSEELNSSVYGTSLFNTTALKYIFYPENQQVPSNVLKKVLVKNGSIELNCGYIEYEENHEFTMVYFHGNGSTCADWVGLEESIKIFQGWNVNVFFAEYRGYGGSGGSPLMVEIFDDLRPILEATGKPQEKIIVYGRSLGSLFAVECAKQFPNLGGLIIDSGLFDIFNWVIEKNTPGENGWNFEIEEIGLEASRVFNTKAKLQNFTKATLILYCRDDDSVSVKNGRQLFSSLESVPEEKKKLVIFKKGGHNHILWNNFEQYVQEVKEFLKKASLNH